MRILDKNTDYYDYLQNIYRDDSLTFDRTDSYLLTKEIMCKHLVVPRTYGAVSKYRKKETSNFLLLQVGNAFWLFLVKITGINEYDQVTDYSFELIANWKNYDKTRVLIQMDIISFKWQITTQLSDRSWDSGYDLNKLFNKRDILVQAVNNNEYRVERKIDKHTIYQSKPVDKHIPLLKACGIARFIDPLDIFLSFEEYFSLEKTAAERTDAIGTTNKDKVENHGFDVKTSFRGK